MKIKNSLQGVGRISNSNSSRSSDSSSENPVVSDSSDGVSISEQTSFIQALRVAAKGQEPLRSELIEQARIDIANGTLGSKEDYEQTINALLREL